MGEITKSQTPSREFLTVAEVAALTGKTTATVRAWIASGQLPAARINRSIMIPSVILQSMISGLPLAALSDQCRTRDRLAFLRCGSLTSAHFGL